MLHRSTYRLFAPDEILDKDEIETQDQIMARVYERLGSQVLPKELEDIVLENTLQYDLYEDETQNEQTFPQLAEELEPMPEVGDQYIGAEILLPRRNKMARGHNTGGNVMGRVHANPIIDTRLYEVKFS